MAIFSNELKLIIEFGRPKRVMGLKVHQDGFKVVNFLEWPSALLNDFPIRVFQVVSSNSVPCIHESRKH